MSTVDAPAAGGGPVRVKLPTAEDPTLILPVFLDRAGPPPGGGRLRPLLRVLAPLAVAMLLLGGAAWLSVATSRRSHEVTVTALSAAPPTAADPAGRRHVQVTATGLPAGSADYTVVVTSADGTRAASHRVTANDRGVWTGRLTLPGLERMTVGLYRTGESAAYRTVIVAAA